MTLASTITRLLGIAAITLTALPALAQVRDMGAIQEQGILGRTVAPDEFKVFHGSEFKGAHKVAVAVFNVAFPDENHFTAPSSGRPGLFGRSGPVLRTSFSGVDSATRQRITDKAYGLFVRQLTAAGYEVVDQAELARLAPEFATWASLPNYSQGKYGTYVVPTGQSLRFLPGDASKRDNTSSAFGVQAQIFALGGASEAFKRSPYVAHDGNIGIIAVNIVVDYGVYSTGHGRASFQPAVTIAAGNVIDRGTMIEYWGTHSGGFPAYAFLQQPILRADRDYRASQKGSDTDIDIVADPGKFEAAADEVMRVAAPKLVGVMAAGR